MKPTLTLLTALLLAPLAPLHAADVVEPAKPNIVLLVADDAGPQLGCYGDRNTRTPFLDRLAGQGCRFASAYACAGVCAPARHSLITGQYPIRTGAHHMRSELTSVPRLFTQNLQDAGYFVVWSGKTDFNFILPPGAFHSQDNWTNPSLFPDRRPVFLYHSIVTTHESRLNYSEAAFAREIKALPESLRHSPSTMAIPSYFPDTPSVRACFSRYYDTITAMDQEIGRILKLIESKMGLDNTLIVFWGDNGWPFPRGKRWLYEAGTRTPLILFWKNRIQAGTVDHRLISSVDLAPTLLAVAGAAPLPKTDGFVFLGQNVAAPRPYVFGARDRMDNVMDRVRSVRDSRYRYIRNFMPEVPYAAPSLVPDNHGVMQAWREWFSLGKLTQEQAIFFKHPRAEEELYDLQSDPEELCNLAKHPGCQSKKKELQAALEQWMQSCQDMGAIPEAELLQRGIIRPFVNPKNKAKKEE